MLVLDIDICTESTCLSCTFSEGTGAYSATTNTTGWGSPNPETSDATAATLTVTMPDGTTTYSFNLLTEGFPTTDNTVGFEILGSDLGYGTNAQIDDGKYTFTYTVVTPSQTYTTSKTKLFYCQTKCCVDRLLAQAANDIDCTCNSENLKKANEADDLLQVLIQAAKCGDVTRFTKIQELLDKYCNGIDCGCS